MKYRIISLEAGPILSTRTTPEVRRKLVLVGHPVASVSRDRGVERFQTRRGAEELRHVRELSHFGSGLIELACLIGDQLSACRLTGPRELVHGKRESFQWVRAGSLAR
jgi:hypothetical protein